MDNSHIIWAADTNYRIDEDNDNVRLCAMTEELSPLLAADQACFLHDRVTAIIANYAMKLRRAMASHDAFIGYQESDITFRPTYKYDLGTSNYDTSEKMRIPAWTGMFPCCRS